MQVIDTVGQLFRARAGTAVAQYEPLQANGAMLGLPTQGMMQAVAMGFNFAVTLRNTVGRMDQAGGSPVEALYVI